jgi:hypothetical protein
LKRTRLQVHNPMSNDSAAGAAAIHAPRDAARALRPGASGDSLA